MYGATRRPSNRRAADGDQALTHFEAGDQGPLPLLGEHLHFVTHEAFAVRLQINDADAAVVDQR